MVSAAPRVALLHEWFASYAGSERVVEQAMAVFPDAPLFALCDFMSEQERGFLGGRRPTTSFIQRLPFAKRKFRGYLPLMPLAVEQFCFDDFDVVLSSSHCVAHGALTRADQLHISYVHSPIRYAWDLQHQYLRESGLTWGLRSMLVRMIMHYMRLWDHASADRTDVFVANSQYVANRVRKTYRRPCEVIYPPVDVEAFAFQSDKDDYYLTASRMVPYKRVDVVVEAFRQLPGKRLVVIGDGPDMKKIKRLAGPNVQLLGHQSFAELRRHMQSARAFVFAADEDFGITPVEAQACGTPCIAYGVGGSLETVAAGRTGLHFEQQTADCVADAIRRFETEADRFEPAAIRAHAERFSIERFRKELAELVARCWDQHRQSSTVQATS
ncbi:glycosyltransferase family 4 protein [Roseimaritima ulvae]|uniref:GDP-mannose-dependent alpha-(1-6)-phosphatidylinositol monomannoside mannosyltransferase n=1 Tax=Roseimaritima ulvae TaxID=980254 RepID=A0A5B9QS34_9BACT|nr:glycosyltransferase family 4 protein [Roseimaritima ulvae]QEG41858.1 GDP-mannose-dependent alpha-(1-6)-phosphatidylinositol monomannoside mannosyltransferase [Roseimaritima ulvae]